MESIRERKKRNTPKYVCARCGEPLSIHGCWIGNEGLLCSRHVDLRAIEKHGRGGEAPRSK